MRETCRVCGEPIPDGDQRVLANGGSRLVHCSQACLNVSVRVVQTAQRKARRRLWAFALLSALALAGAGTGRHFLRKLRSPPKSVASPPAAAKPEAPPEPPRFGPSWPPTDAEWIEQFAKAAWTDPLPGPTRRQPVSCRELPVEPAPGPGARCRTELHCGVDLGGELWGEHVYAVLDGVIDRVQRTSEEAPGGVYVRISHWGGVVFTHYFHLAAVPTRLTRGAHVSAGDVIGLVGDHLHFALSVRPSSEYPEVFWDPAPLMAGWALQTPGRGSVAGLISVDAPAERLPETPLPHRHASGSVKTRRTAGD